MPDVTTGQYSTANRNTGMPEETYTDMPQEFDSRRVDNKSYGHQRKIADQHQKTRSADSEPAPPPRAEEELDDERKSWQLKSPRMDAEYRR